MTLRIVLTLVLITLAQSTNIVINTKPILNEEPKLLASVANGQKFIIGDLNDPERNVLYVANVKGTPFQMGEAYGQLFKEELKDQLDMFYKYYLDALDKEVEAKLPKFLSKHLKGATKMGLRSALELNVLITKKYTNKRYYEEIEGMAKGSGIHADEFAKLNIFPELIKAACTIAAVWGPAAEDGKTVHMRALDWDAQNPISKYPLAVIYHPSNKKWNPHVNFAWVGFVGSLTGFSNKISIGEKVWLPPKGTVQMTRYGNPWTYVFRDVLYEANNLQDAIRILSTAHRTCAIHVGVGSVADKSFRMFEYSYRTLNIYDDANYTHYGANHPKLPGVAYFDKHVQPSKDSQVGDVINSYMYGHWEMESFWRMLGFTHKTGNTQLAVFDLEDQEVLISYSQFNTTINAYERRPIYLNMELWFKDF